MVSGSWVRANYQTSTSRKKIDILGDKATRLREKLSITLNVMHNLTVPE
jgi:hypothetical protein